MNLYTVRKTFTDWAPFYNPTHSWTLPKRRVAHLALDLKPGMIADVNSAIGASK